LKLLDLDGGVRNDNPSLPGYFFSQLCILQSDVVQTGGQ
jgi:hypothetical protein